MKKKRLLIIPAKSFSSRIKNKNFKNFCGKPMIRYPYDSAIKSKLFDKIHISTESKTIKKKLSKMKIKIDFLRPKKLTKNKIGLFEVYKFVFQEYKKKGLLFDEVWALLPCTPLINYKDLINLKKNIENKKLKKPIISVSKYNAPIEWAFTLGKNKKLFPKNKKKHLLPSQSFKTAYYDVGSIAVFDIKNFNTIRNFHKGHFYGFELPLQKSIDIDDKKDWDFAKYLKTI
tara:strand:+ start:343 stop:1032 length:690 start_codon:yes stop_codon:yes gene_type:complete